MKGLFFTRQDDLAQQVAHPQMDALKLLAKHGPLEIMHQHILRGATVWLTPTSGSDELEFFYLCSGLIRFVYEGQETTLRAGDSFHTHGLSGDVVLTIEEETNLLYVSTSPVFDDNARLQNELISLLHQIDDKDHYTLQHSVNVRNYALQLWQAMPERQTISFGDMVLASLFHDVGKCRIPDAVLKKPGRYTPDEYEIMKQHAQASGELLAERFPGKPAVIASQHHERLDGSGYPNHLSGDEICFESRVIAVADCFDAMTTKRVYSTPRSEEEAAQELCDMSSIYDAEIAQTLLRLVRSGKLVINEDVEL